MRALVTFGPTCEPIDKVRRLTNFSTGQLGTGLANFLHDAGHTVLALRGSLSTFPGACLAQTVRTFTTTADLSRLLHEAARENYDAIFHAAAVSDFIGGQMFRRNSDGSLEAVRSGKFSTRDGSLLLELIPTPKIIHDLRTLFPAARLFGWKYEVDGSRDDVIALGIRQISDNQTDFCVVNGPAYGSGFGIVAQHAPLQQCGSAAELYAALLQRFEADRR
jgi:phosphopantothenoylcysteine decarboxylase/phosphopantothenate--cysteine ligase